MSDSEHRRQQIVVSAGFLKLAFVVIGLFCVGYLVVYMNGEINHEDRGALVRKFNDATMTSPVLMYAVAALSLVYIGILVAFAIRKHKEE